MGKPSVSKNPEFLTQIINDVDLGRAFVPLIGSGLSSASGIIMGVEFTNYLAFATYLVLADPERRERTHGEGKPSRWNFVIQGWPPFPSDSEVLDAKNWIRSEFVELCEQRGFRADLSSKDERIRFVGPSDGSGSDSIVTKLATPPIPRILASSEAEHSDEQLRRLLSLLANRDKLGGDPPISSSAFTVDELTADPRRSYSDRVVEIGLRSLHDWRETLVFLSSVRINRSQRGSNRLVIEHQNPSVIDAFNQFITRDKQPNLGHKMLAHLSGPMRISTILTTNFDTLTEDAYTALDLSLRVVPVTTSGRLPEPQIVAASNTLVKLHGEAQSTRADLSLDEEPSDYDLETFAAYLTRGAGNLGVFRLDYATYEASRSFGFAGAEQHTLKNERLIEAEAKRLLVIGYSGSDHRCVQMIKNWLEHGPVDSMVYWICFSKWDTDRIGNLFSSSQYENKVVLTQSSRPDLLLYGNRPPEPL